MTSPHIIRRQYLHIEVNGTESEGLALQRRLPDWCQHQLTPALAQVLDRCDTPQVHLKIERLELDLGMVRLESLEQDLAASVARALEKSLLEKIPPAGSAPPISSGNLRQEPPHQAINETLIYFLETGSLPWFFRLPAGSNLEQEIIRSWKEAAAAGLNLGPPNEAILRALASATVRQRMIRQFSPTFLETLLARLAPEGMKIMSGLLQTLRRVGAPPGDIKHFEQLLWEALFTRIAGSNLPEAPDLVTEAWTALPAATAAQLASGLELNWPGVTRKVPAMAPRIAREEPPHPGLPESGRGPVAGSEHPEAVEGIYIENSGLVLLHPFLPLFFEGLGIAAADRLLQPGRALCLLHCLATGQSAAPEYELVLNKILCGIPLTFPAETDVELTDLEKQEASVLLEAVIGHWKALRNTSPDGLRGTFLLRPGKVSQRADGDWLLQVEARACDILLDELPWGISMIRLPWMDRILWVEWR